MYSSRSFAAVLRNSSSHLKKTSRAALSTNLVTDYFSSLRWRATETLTSLMTKEEKEKLLKQMNIVVDVNTKQQEEPDVQKTIAEAVVAARQEEAQRQEAQWEREKERLHKEAEQAAYARVEADIKIQQQRAAAMEKWQADLAKEQVNGSSAVTTATTTNDAHPLLGQVLADFGFKRLHVVSADILKNIPVWKKQRIYRHDRAKAMAADKLKSAHFGLPGVIALHEDSDGKLFILDGQHRVGMMTILQEKKTQLSFDLDRVLVEVFPEHKDNQYETYAQDIFTEINKAEPIKLVDMPGVAKGADRKVITEGASRLKEAYPDMFKPSQACRPPHLNIDNLRDALFAADIINRHNLKSPKALEDWMMQQNDALRTQFQDEQHAAKVNKKALKKARDFDFYLGIDSSWYYNWVNESTLEEI